MLRLLACLLLNAASHAGSKADPADWILWRATPIAFPDSITPLMMQAKSLIDSALPREYILLDEGVMSANISDNTSRAPFTVSNKAKGKTVVRDNLSEA